MNVFRIIRRALWSIILAACIVVGCIYLAFSQVFLTPSGLTHIVKQSTITETVRSEVLLPQIISFTQKSEYAGLLDDKLVTDAFNATVTNDILSAKLTPAIESVSSWLNSTEPSIKFSINMDDLSGPFADQLNTRVSAKIAALPACTFHNTLADVENGVCRSPLLTTETVTANINDTIKNNPAISESITVTPETVPLLSPSNRGGSSLPSYLNILYGISVIAAGVIGLVGLWLLLKHRLGGIITLGVACVIAALILMFASTTFIPLALTSIDNPLLSSVAMAATESLRVILQQQVTYLATGGSIAIVLATLILFIISRRRASRESMTINHRTPTPEI